jgi:hypothetical protein
MFRLDLDASLMSVGMAGTRCGSNTQRSVLLLRPGTDAEFIGTLDIDVHVSPLHPRALDLATALVHTPALASIRSVVVTLEVFAARFVVLFQY